MKLSAILLAAGKGMRYKEIKQDVLFHNKPLWRYAYDTTVTVLGYENIVIVGKDIPGGDTRARSVMNGLAALPEDTDRVIIVEAARPMVTEYQIRQLVENSHPSVSFVSPLVNSVVHRNGLPIDREELYNILTPQAFDYKLLRDAYLSGKFDNVTEELRVMYEFYGIRPYFIETGTNLYKVTYPGDLEIIESIYQQLKKEDL